VESRASDSSAQMPIRTGPQDQMPMHAAAASQNLAMQVSQKLVGGPAQPASADGERGLAAGTASGLTCAPKSAASGHILTSTQPVASLLGSAQAVLHPGAWPR